MMLQQWGVLAEVVSAIAVVVSLIYVGMQIRQSANASRAATTQAFSQQYADSMFALLDPDFSDVWLRGLSGLEELEDEERVSFFAMLNAISRMWESFYYQNSIDELDSALLEPWMVQYMDLHGNNGVKEFWRIRKHQYSADFVAYIDRRVAQSNPRPLYGDEVA